MSSIAVRVARGVDWLDRTYPGWWADIDLAVLSVASCHRCVLGQVYTRCIPADERGQIMAQLLTNSAVRTEMAGVPEWGGFNVLYFHHDLESVASALGFAAGNPAMTIVREFELLTDEWTRVIIARRIDANLAEVTALWEANRAEVGQPVAA